MFKNQTVTESGKPVRLSFSIYPNKDSAYTLIDNGGGETIHRENAIYTSPEELPGDVAKPLSLPALAPGNYWMQWDGNPDFMHAWLVVQ